MKSDDSLILLVPRAGRKTACDNARRVITTINGLISNGFRCDVNSEELQDGRVLLNFRSIAAESTKQRGLDVNLGLPVEVREAKRLSELLVNPAAMATNTPEYSRIKRLADLGVAIRVNTTEIALKRPPVIELDENKTEAGTLPAGESQQSLFSEYKTVNYFLVQRYSGGQIVSIDENGYEEVLPLSNRGRLVGESAAIAITMPEKAEEAPAKEFLAKTLKAWSEL